VCLPGAHDLPTINRATMSHVSDTGPSKAKENQNKAIEIFKECGADGWVEKYKKDLAAL
jgi:hypothetical protein